MSRTHPGETNSNFIMNEIINYLLSDKFYAKKLRHLFVFKIFPMVNPDGVRYGNYKCSLFGEDLSKKWHDSNIITHTSIHHIKKYIKQIKS